MGNRCHDVAIDVSSLMKIKSYGAMQVLFIGDGK
jgi:hypothetical protein